MATVKKGALGEFRGKIQDTVLTKWMGLLVARGLPSKSTKRPKQSTLEKRHLFGMVSHVLQQFFDSIAIGYPSNRRSCSNMNIAVQSALDEAVIGTYPNESLDPNKIRLSFGALSQVYNVRGEIDKDDPWKFIITWQNPYVLKLGLSEYDSVQVFALTEQQEEVFSRLYPNAGYRGDTRCSIRLPKTSRVSMQVWMFLLSKDGKQASPTRYLGKFMF
jgi:hypothetical protein